MDKDFKKMDDETIISTPQPSATSTELRKRHQPRIGENIVNVSRTEDSDESLGLISISSENIGPYIDDVQLKETSSEIKAFAREQRELANKMLQRRESKNLGLPSRLPRLSEISSGSRLGLLSCSSTVSESDLLAHNTTSTPRNSISGNMETLDIAGTLARMSLELKDPNMSLSMVFDKLHEGYDKIHQSLSNKSDMFKPAEEAEQQLLADEVSWRREKDLPAERVEFSLNNFDTSKISSMSAYFKQRTEDLSHIIPSKPGRDSEIRNTLQNLSKSSVVSMPSSISSINTTASTDGEFEYASSECELAEIPSTPEPFMPRESLSISKIAQILQESEETPSKVLKYLLKHCSDLGPMENQKQVVSTDTKEIRKNLLSSIQEKTDYDSGNYDPSTLTPNKENFDCSNAPQQSSLGKMFGISKSLTSLRSTSSLSTLPGGKLPIETTHCELVWGCVKMGKSETKQFTIRNKSQSKVQILCSITSPLFRIMQDRGEDTSNSIRILLRAHETKCVTVIFNPLSEGAAIDEIVFSPCNPSLQPIRKQSVKLYGYGGNGSIEFKDRLLKDGSGRHWLSLGSILGQSVVGESLTVMNKGSLPAFAFLEYTSKDLAFSKISISPEVVVLGPHEERKIDITLKLTREDMKYVHNNLSNSAFEIGTVKMISGTEATRGRIKRLCKLVVDRNLELDSLGRKLMKDIPGEAIPADVIKCRESITSLKSLLLGLSQKEIVMVVEKDLDATLVPVMSDDTSMFHSLYQESTFTEELVKNNCKLEPSLVLLNPPAKSRDILFFTSESNHDLSFKIEVPKGMRVNIMSGTLRPHATLVLQLQIEDISKVSAFSRVSVNVEGDILYSDVKVKCI